MRITTAGLVPQFTASRRCRLLRMWDFMGFLRLLFKAATLHDPEGSWLLLAAPILPTENSNCCLGVLVWQGEEGPARDHGAAGLAVSVSVLKGTKEGMVLDPRDSWSWPRGARWSWDHRREKQPLPTLAQQEEPGVRP